MQQELAARFAPRLIVQSDVMMSPCVAVDIWATWGEHPVGPHLALVLPPDQLSGRPVLACAVGWKPKMSNPK